MKTTTSKRIRVLRFLGNRYAYRERSNYLAELMAFGIIAITATWSLFSAASAMTVLR